MLRASSSPPVTHEAIDFVRGFSPAWPCDGISLNFKAYLILFQSSVTDTKFNFYAYFFLSIDWIDHFHVQCTIFFPLSNRL